MFIIKKIKSLINTETKVNIKINFFEKLPNVNISQIGQYLNYLDTIKVYRLSKNCKFDLISKFQTCTKICYKNHKYKKLNEYYIYKS